LILAGIISFGSSVLLVAVVNKTESTLGRMMVDVATEFAAITANLCVVGCIIQSLVE